MSNTDVLEVLDTIQGSSYEAIRSALKVVENRKLKLAEYGIEVLQEKDGIAVLFADKESRFAVRPQAQVMLSRSDLRELAVRKDKLQILDTIQGASLLAIQAAMERFQRHDPEIAAYQIEVVKEGDALIVIFTGKDREPGTRGHVRSRPGFEVELDARDLKVRRSNFIR